MMSFLHIPFIQPLSPFKFFSAKTDYHQYFPFSSQRIRYYYLARNGIWHAIDSFGLRPGDGVLMPAYHHGVEVEVLKKKGLRLFYYRIDDKMQIDLDYLESLISSNVRLLYVIHYLGFPQPITKLCDFVSRHGLLLFEDCALSLFSKSNEGPLGSFGDASIFCLYKTLSVPHGGMLVLNNPHLPLPSLPERPNLASTSEYLFKGLLSHFELKWDGVGHGFSFLLYNLGRTFKKISRFKNIQIDTNKFEEEVVSMGISRMTKFLINRVEAEKIVRRRRENFLYLSRLLEGKVWMPFTDLPEGTCPLSFPIFARDKQDVYSRLISERVETITFWSVGNPDIPEGMFPEVDFLRKHVLELPIHQELEKRQLDYIALKVKEFAKW